MKNKFCCRLFYLLSLHPSIFFSSFLSSFVFPCLLALFCFAFRFVVLCSALLCSLSLSLSLSLLSALCSLLSLSFNRKRKLNAWVDNPSLSRLRRLSPIKLYRRKCISRREVWRLSVLSSMGITNTCRILIELQEAVGYPCVYWTHNDIQQNFICMFTQKGMSFAAISRSATTFRNMKSVAID